MGAAKSTLIRSVGSFPGEPRNGVTISARSNVAATDRWSSLVVGESQSIRDAIALATQVATSRSVTVLLVGETGTGKELFARGVHSESARAEDPFVAINCAAIPETLLESELFGHEPGAFTDARTLKRGLFEVAGSGTVFLDEVAELPLKLQAKLLRVVEERRFRRLGGSEERKLAARIVAGTNVALETAVAENRFRADLFYRLNVIPFELPPLRERLEDVPLLVEHFNRKFCGANTQKPKRFAPNAIEAMQNYAWPGNVRELRNTIERVCIMHAPMNVGAGDLPPLGGEDPPAASSKYSSFKDAGEAHQREFIKKKLLEADGNVSHAAELMGIDRSHLYRRMRALGINVRDERAGTT